jgi:cbb3-type cytochrome oxidase cytochrome c subunit
MRWVKLPPQILRLVLLTLAIVGSYLIARAFLTPQTFGEYGWYRRAALEEIAARTPVFAGKQACDECHSDILQKLAKDAHRTLSCEACHGVSREHADNPDILPVKATGNYCLRCHEANLARPSWFKQIVVKNHYSGKCTECHLPHQPNQSP